MSASEYATALREIADWYEAHPDVPAPSPAPINLFFGDKDELVAVARAVGERLTKSGSGDWYWLRKEFPSGWALEFNVRREQVCTRRVVGTEPVPEQIIPAHTKEIVEWDCHSLLAQEAPERV